MGPSRRQNDFVFTQNLLPRTWVHMQRIWAQTDNALFVVNNKNNSLHYRYFDQKVNPSANSFAIISSMTNDQIIEKTRAYVEEKFNGEGSGHDWWHMYRVWKLAKHIA